MQYGGSSGHLSFIQPKENGPRAREQCGGSPSSSVYTPRALGRTPLRTPCLTSVTILAGPAFCLPIHYAHRLGLDAPLSRSRFA